MLMFKHGIDVNIFLNEQGDQLVDSSWFHVGIGRGNFIFQIGSSLFRRQSTR